MASVCGRRRDIEDAVSIYPSFCRQVTADLHFYGVYDGHGCSHVALKCKAEMHQIVKDAVDNEEQENWKETMERSFSKMDKEVEEYRNTAVKNMDCRCELQMQMTAQTCCSKSFVHWLQVHRSEKALHAAAKPLCVQLSCNSNMKMKALHVYLCDHCSNSFVHWLQVHGLEKIMDSFDELYAAAAYI